MKAQEIQQIADAVVANLSGGASPLGCGAISAPDPYRSAPVFSCSGGYTCGGAARFDCPEAFSCVHDFYCPGTFTVPPSCEVQFSCGQGYVDDNRCLAQEVFGDPICPVQEMFTPE
jgi:hypothetical protein